MTTTTKQVAEYVYRMGFDQFDPEVINKAKALCVSALGMTVAGARIHAGQVLADYARDQGGQPRAGVIAADFRSTAELAAFVNATAAHSTELEDDSWPESMYNCHIIPAVFALGEELGSTGKEIIEAFVIGYEVQARPGMILTDGGATERGWLTAPHLGTIGVAAAAAKLFKLNEHEIQMAISLAVSQASGSTRQMGTGAHLYEAGVAARNGISAARLAKMGLTGVPNILEGPKGYFDALAGMPNIDFELGSGKDFRVMQIGFKKYTACYLMQRVIDGVIELVNEHDLTADDIETVSVEVNPTFPEIIKFPEPQNGEESRFSMHHCVAAALMREDISVHTFTDEGARDPRLMAHWHKTQVVVNPEWKRAILGEKNPLTITTTDGRQFHKVCITSHGDPEDPLSDDEVRHKYMTCVEGIIDTDQAHHGADLIFELDQLDNVFELMQLLTFPSEKRVTHAA